MFRRILCAVLRLALRIYFRRVEIVGVENVPADKPVIFVLNHPNALVDPVFLLCLAPRRVSFLAKAPLFRMPVIGSLVRALDSLPAYRQQDAGEDVTRNRETFEAAWKLLSRGGTIGICPEGVSHNEPRLKPLKTGAARIALGAASSGGQLDVKIVPVGLYYTEKTTFRSSALLRFGEPINVEPVELQPDGAPPREAVHALRKQIEEALRDVILHAEHDEALALVDRVEQIFSADELSEHDEEQSLARSLQVRQRLLEGYGILRTHSPKRIAAIDVRVNRLHSELQQAGIDPFDLSLPALGGPDDHLADCAVRAFSVAGAIRHCRCVAALPGLSPGRLSGADPFTRRAGRRLHFQDRCGAAVLSPDVDRDGRCYLGICGFVCGVGSAGYGSCLRLCGHSLRRGTRSIKRRFSGLNAFPASPSLVPEVVSRARGNSKRNPGAP